MNLNEYYITLKHDNGKRTIYTRATSEEQAKIIVCNAEGAPLEAIIKIRQRKYWVAMTDKFMSGWGMAKEKTNKFVVECDTYEEAQTIERNALKRPEMKYVNIRITKPRYGANVLVSEKHYNNLGESWTK